MSPGVCFAGSSVLFGAHQTRPVRHTVLPGPAAFKGTSTIGTKDYQKERALLSAMDETFYELREAEKQRRADDIKKLKVCLSTIFVLPWPPSEGILTFACHGPPR